MTIGSNVIQINDQLKKRNCALVAISKTKGETEILEAYRAGQRDFGENKVQELTWKYNALPKDIRWHMVGHLQSNKVKYVAGFVHLIHSVDSLRLLQEIHKQGEKGNRVIDCLLQVHISEEETKFGFSDEEINALLQSGKIAGLNRVRIKGLMGMASFTDNEDQVRKEFGHLKELFDRFHTDYHGENVSFEILSMGMSSDYPIALESGSNMVRIGTSIFGERNYSNE